MAGLKDLNVDLLYVIFSHLQSDKRQLHDIALSCRLFRDIAQRFIVRDVTLSHSPMHSRTKLFLRTLEERPDLTVQVHCLRFDLLREDIHWPEEQHVISRITRLLTNLREFCYLSRDYKPWHYGVSLPLKWWRDGVHDQVRRVEWHHNMQPKALVKCMQLPRIESIYCRELQDISTKSSSISIVSPDLYGSSSVRELHIGSHLGLPFDALRLMLQVPRCLRKLVLSYHDEFQSGAQVDRIPWLLEPVQESLEELSIEKHRGMLPPPGEVVDLSALCCLRKLSIPFRYVFGKRPGKSFKADTLLPPQLSELRMSFISTKRAIDISGTSENFEALISWLGDIHVQEGPPLRMPNLATVILEESELSGYHDDLLGWSVARMIKMWKSFENDGTGRLRILGLLKEEEGD